MAPTHWRQPITGFGQLAPHKPGSNTTPKRRGIIQAVDNTTTPTTTSPAPKPEPPNCDLDETAKLHREADDFNRRNDDFKRRVAAHNRKPTLYDIRDPVQRQAFADYEKEGKALRAEGTRLQNEGRDLKEKLGECGIKIGDNGIVEWPDASTTTTSTPALHR